MNDMQLVSLYYGYLMLVRWLRDSVTADIDYLLLGTA